MIDRLLNLILLSIIGDKSRNTKKDKKNIYYVCDSVFPSRKVMNDVIEILSKDNVSGNSPKKNNEKTYATNS